MDSKIVSDILKSELDKLPRITMGDLYNKYVEAISDISLMEFKANVSKWLSDGTLSEYESRRGPTGGIYRKGSPNEPLQNHFKKRIPSENTNDLVDELSVSEGVFTIQIAPTLRIVQSDDRNWAIQKKSGEAWISKCYHGELSGMLKSAIKHIVNGDFKLSNSTVVQLTELHVMIKNMEERLVTKLQETIQDGRQKKES